MPTNFWWVFLLHLSFYSLCQQIAFSMLCLSTLRQMPTADINTTRDVEPDEMNGSGRPVGGIEPVTTATLMSVCTAMTAATPIHKRQPNLSRAPRPILISLITKTAKTTSKSPAPTNPNSSAMIEKMKSLSENGKNKYFWRELKRPTPNQPPEPIE